MGPAQLLAARGSAATREIGFDLDGGKLPELSVRTFSEGTPHRLFAGRRVAQMGVRDRQGE
jgi:hypothetical protein